MPAWQALPRSAETYFAGLAREADEAIRATRRRWSRVSADDVVESYAAARAQLLAVVLTAQSRMARPAAGYFSSVLAETGQMAAPVAAVAPAALVGWAGDGRAVEGLLDVAPRITLARIGQGVAPVEALDQGRKFLDKAVTTTLWDTSRAAETLESAVRPGVEGYIRMLNPGVHGACSRCVVLAGRWYRKNRGFERHPNCRCTHIPASEATGDDIRVNPDAYFESLTKAEQDRIFTSAGAEVIREGADIAQVVNARRGMHTAQVNQRGWIPRGRMEPVERFGRQVYVTTEGTTRRGAASRALTGRRGERLMPESILTLADDRDDLLRMLRLHGYITP